jgi:hypothetical protein
MQTHLGELAELNADKLEQSLRASCMSIQLSWAWPLLPHWVHYPWLKTSLYPMLPPHCCPLLGGPFHKA